MAFMTMVITTTAIPMVTMDAAAVAQAAVRQVVAVAAAVVEISELQQYKSR
jgi:hypothetical protein